MDFPFNTTQLQINLLFPGFCSARERLRHMPPTTQSLG